MEERGRDRRRGYIAKPDIGLRKHFEYMRLRSICGRILRGRETTSVRRESLAVAAIEGECDRKLTINKGGWNVITVRPEKKGTHSQRMKRKERRK